MPFTTRESGTTLHTNSLFERGIEYAVSCKKPLIRIAKQLWNGETSTIRIVGATDPGFDKFYEYYKFQQELADKSHERIIYQRIPCGKCIGCKLDYSKEWATRCTLEASCYKHNWFITYTYDPKHVPKKEEFYDKEGHVFTEPSNDHWSGYLEPEHMVLFHKRLRQYLVRQYNHVGMRFFMCGEYGGPPKKLPGNRMSEGYRPHYHEIAFNMPIDIRTLKFVKMNEKGFPIFECDWLTELWGMGIVTVQEFCWSAAAYTARYCTKKITGDIAPLHYCSRGQTPEFIRMSRMPGIGHQFYEMHKGEIYDLDEIILKVGKEEVRSIKPAKYYDRLYDVEYPDDMKRIKQIRKEKGEALERIKMTNTSLTLLKQLELEERSLIDKTKSLRRDLVN